jgi:hypothetical protein
VSGEGGPLLFKKGCFGTTPTDDIIVSSRHGISVNGKWGKAADFKEFASKTVLPTFMRYFNVVTSPHSLIYASGVPISTWSETEATQSKMPLRVVSENFAELEIA